MPAMILPLISWIFSPGQKYFKWPLLLLLGIVLVPLWLWFKSKIAENAVKKSSQNAQNDFTKNSSGIQDVEADWLKDGDDVDKQKQ